MLDGESSPELRRGGLAVEPVPARGGASAVRVRRMGDLLADLFAGAPCTTPPIEAVPAR
jgi:hypothetical protein